MWLDLVIYFLQWNVARKTFVGVLSYESSRSCSLRSGFLGILLLLWEEAKAGLLGSERPHGDREKPS